LTLGLVGRAYEMGAPLGVFEEQNNVDLSYLIWLRSVREEKNAGH
jgi:hypothetical protein